MKHLFRTVAFSILVLLSIACSDGVPSVLKKNEFGAKQFVVNGEPFMMVAGEIHNSSASTIEYLNSLWAPLKSLNLNTVLATVAWEQLEPEEGVYDFSLVDNMIGQARKNDLKLVLLWFASWKNGESSYAPTWVKRDTERFFRVQKPNGEIVETLSPFCEETMKADAKAFAALCRHLRKTDSRYGTVIAIQPENESGIFLDMDYSKVSLKAYERDVPAELLTYMVQNKETLREELYSVWKAHGEKTSGKWCEVFGDNIWSKTFYTTWQVASYINNVASCGKAEYPLPMFCNCWLVQHPEELPGSYPNGGPVSRVMDIWKAAAPAIDILSPDIYLDDFKGIVADYHREDNPLLVPESLMKPELAFWAFAEHDAMCYSPFGIEDGEGNYVFAQSYDVLRELMPIILKFQGSDRIAGIMNTGEKERVLKMGKYTLTVKYEKKDAYGLVIRTEEDEFLVAGINFKILFSSDSTDSSAYIQQVWEGRFDDAEWVPTRLLNGDETLHNSALIARGRKTITSEFAGKYNADHSEGVFVYSPETFNAIWSPAIYKVRLYER